MAPFNQETVIQIQDDLARLFAKYDLTAGYLVAENNDPASEKIGFCTVVVSALAPSKPSALMQAMAQESFRIIQGVSTNTAHVTEN